MNYLKSSQTNNFLVLVLWLDTPDVIVLDIYSFTDRNIVPCKRFIFEDDMSLFTQLVCRGLRTDTYSLISHAVGLNNCETF